MEKKKISFFKILMTFLFAGLTLGAYLYVIFKGDFTPAYLSYGCIGLCFVFSLIFIRTNSKKILITLALAANFVADYFLVFSPSEENKLIGVCIFCVVQFFFLIYTLCLNGSIGTRIINIAFRVALCALAYFILPRYFVLGTLELVSIMYFLNFFASLLVFVIHIKTEWLLLLGFLLFFVCDIFVGLTNGGIDIFGIVGPFVDFLRTYDIAFYCYIPGVFLIATSSVWAKKKDLKNI